MTITFHFVGGNHKSISCDYDQDARTILETLGENKNIDMEFRNGRLVVIASNVTYVEAV